MEKERRNTGDSVKFNKIMSLLKKALEMYVYGGKEKIREEEEYKLYRKQYPFEKYYYFKEEFKYKWE